MGPAERLQRVWRPSRPRPDISAGHARAVGLAEGVPARDQRDRLLVVHRHSTERLADVLGGGDRIAAAVRPFGVDVDQAHLHRGERMREVAIP